MKFYISGVKKIPSVKNFMKQKNDIIKDNKKLKQCINCKYINDCTRDEKKENDICNFYEPVESLYTKSFKEILDSITKGD